MEITKKSFTIINRHYPPNPGITGESAWDLAKYLIEKYDAEIHIIHINRNDDGGGQIRQPIGILHPINTVYHGKNGFFRLFSGTLDGFMLVWKARKIAKGTIICMTSPPLLPFWASLFLKNWVLWSMDLFPEGFVSANTIKSSNFLYRWIIKKTYQNPPRQLIALGENQGKFLENSYKTSIKTTILPCGVLFHQQNDTEKPAWKKEENKIYFGYCGNLGQAHSAEFLEVFINNFDAQKYHLILAIYGEKAGKIIDFAKNMEGITVLPSVPRSQLHFIDVHLVSLLKVWTHVAVPSKAISSICAGASVLFCGSRESDTWSLTQNAGWFIEENEKIDAQIKDFFRKINQNEVETKRKMAQKMAINLQKMVVEAYDSIAAL